MFALQVVITISVTCTLLSTLAAPVPNYAYSAPSRSSSASKPSAASPYSPKSAYSPKRNASPKSAYSSKSDVSPKSTYSPKSAYSPKSDSTQPVPPEEDNIMLGSFFRGASLY
ncbi:hypothetical protein FRB94_007628 [Tulasnella sp. JGI-2019a]|nr:hypothetical protein FRB93_007335 [Tulasnella sp. JGI-2019a]KAG8997535.1 hypothetical protein FRB94_007628 [Tulasnella sp. JGI-2019a]KAG9030091.1 hypothetical protein FRB95_004331 [Tulasnella sp. JGI-2019a]